MRSPLPRTAITILAAFTFVTGVAGQGVPAKPDDAAILHVLNRIGFGARPGDIDAVRHMGLDRYLDRQLHPETIDDGPVAARLAGLETLAMSSRDLAEAFFIPAQQARQQKKGDDPAMRTPIERRPRQVLMELSQQKVLRAAYSERQLQEVMTDFWFNHFNVFAGKGATQQFVTEYEREAIRPHVLGRFRDLLGATAKSPAMLFYLDNWQSADPDGPAARRQRMVQPDRPRRGLNENYGRELMELHTLGVDGGYTQQDVVNVARAFTGWTIEQPRRGGGFRFDPRLHDRGEKIVLGHRLRAGGDQSDGERVLDILAAHPSTATFIATKLARRFVSDVPPPALVDRAAARFRETTGDIREVVRLILTSPEFFAAAAVRAKVKTPFEFVVSAIRATGADVRAAAPLVQAVRQLGMPLYMCQPPTGYADRADAWINTGALLNRMNFSIQLMGGRMRGVTNAQPPLASLVGPLAPATAATIGKGTQPAQTAALTLGSPEFQRR
jgi:uncharacterized protein (DUF1800 family)